MDTVEIEVVKNFNRPDFNRPFAVHTDDCCVSIGAILTQMD